MSQILNPENTKMKLFIPIADLLIAISTCSRAQEPTADFAKECAGRVQAGKFSVQGDDKAWFFMAREL